MILSIRRWSLKVFTLYLGFTSHHLFANEKHMELESFSKLIANHTPGTLYVLDLDNTTMRPKEFIGSDPWFIELTDRAKEQGIEYDQWRKVLNTVVAEISDAMEIQFADPAFSDFYQAVGPESLIGLTARSQDFQRDLTFRHFQRLGIAFRPKEFIPNYDNLNNMHGTTFAPESGVIIVGRLNKGVVLADFIARHTTGVTRLVFIDDLAKHADSVAEATQNLGIPVESYRLTFSDTYITDYMTKFRGTWKFENFLETYVFGRYHEQLQKYPDELAVLNGVLQRAKSAASCEDLARKLSPD